MATLDNRAYFPAFCELPSVDGVDMSYFTETPQGMLLPSRTWCFIGEIVNDSLSQMPTFGNRAEVRDVYGEVRHCTDGCGAGRRPPLVRPFHCFL